MNTFVICGAINKQTYPEITYGMGTYFVVWMDERSGNAANYQLYGTTVSVHGTVTHPDGIHLNPDGLYTNMYPALTAANSRFFMAWYCWPNVIYGQFIDSTGNLAGDTIRIATMSQQVYQGYNVQVAYDGTNFFVVWVDIDTKTNVRGQLVSAIGTPIGSMIVITDSVYHNASLGLAFTGTQYLVTYVHELNNALQVFGRYYNLAGQPQGGEFRISQSGLACRFNDVCAGPGGRTLNVWTDSSSVTGNDIAGCLLEPTGMAETDTAKNSPGRSYRTIFSRSLSFPGLENERLLLFDATGSLIAESHHGVINGDLVSPGVYFLIFADRSIHKVIIVK